MVTLLVLSGLKVHAQDTIRQHPLTYYTEDMVDKNHSRAYADSGMNEVEIFHPLYRNHVIFQDLGNIGTASRNAYFILTRNIGFTGTVNPYENYFLQGKNTKYYNTLVPLTEIFYTQGKQELLFLKVKHAQNILPRWSAGVDFQRLTSEGFLLQQKTGFYNTQINTRYYSKNKRYELLGYVMWNRGYNQENGGIQNDSAFEALSGASKNVNVNLNYSQNTFKQRSIFVKQYYKFGQPITRIQAKDTLYDFQSRFQFSHSILAEDINYMFTNEGDSLNALLPNQYYTNTPNLTYDSLYNGTITNKLLFHFWGIDKNQKNLYMSAGITHQAAMVGQPAYVRSFQNIIANTQFDLVNNNNNSFSLWSKLAHNLAGFNAGDFSHQFWLRYRLSFVDAGVGLAPQKYRPEYQLLKFASNQFIWDNNFKQTQRNQIQFSLLTRKFKHNFVLIASLQQISNYVFVDSTLTPKQSTIVATVNQVSLTKTFQLRKFFFTHKVFWQSSNTYQIPVPDFGGMIRYYFETNFFTGKLQLGVSGFYNSSYYGMSWSPASRLFYLQQQTKMGNYLVVDPFITLQIKRAIIFAKAEHANQNLINEGFYNTPHYPISLRSVRLGVRWRMYN